MKKYVKFLLTIILLFSMSIRSYSSDFIVTIESTDSQNGLIYPMKSGSSYQLDIGVKNIIMDTCKVSLDFNHVGIDPSWLSISGQNQTLKPGQTGTFELTITVPTNASDGDYFLYLYFDGQPRL